MDALTITKHELITLLKENEFEHLSQNEKARLRDYLGQIMSSLQEAADSRSRRHSRPKRTRVRMI